MEMPLKALRRKTHSLKLAGSGLQLRGLGYSEILYSASTRMLPLAPALAPARPACRRTALRHFHQARSHARLVGPAPWPNFRFAVAFCVLVLIELALNRLKLPLRHGAVSNCALHGEPHATANAADADDADAADATEPRCMLLPMGTMGTSCCGFQFPAD